MDRESPSAPEGVATSSPGADEPPPGVAARLDALRSLYVAESIAEAEARLARERPVTSQRFEVAVARRLRELRALLDLAGYLHRVRPPQP